MMKKILICGGSNGLGSEITNNFLSNGKCQVIVVSRKKKNLINIKKKINSKNLHCYICDLTNENQTILLMKNLKKKFRSIDLVVSSVGSSNMKTTGQENYNEWLRAYNSNFFSQTNITENFVKFFKNKKLKKIILISSIAAYFKGGAPLSYSLAKKSLNMYVENISKYLAQFNININTISPGHILQKNNLWEKKINKNKKKTFKMINNTVGLKRFCKPDDVINVINFLACEKSNYITGADFKVDGKTT